MKKLLFLLVASAGAACSAADVFNGKDLSGWTAVSDYSVTGGYSATEPTWAVKDAAFGRPQTTRRYLQGPLSERLLVFFREGKVTLGEIVHRPDWRSMPYADQRAHGIWLVRGEDDEPFDFRAARMRCEKDGTPVQGQSWREGTIEVDMEACAPLGRRPNANVRIRFANAGATTYSGKAALLLRTAFERDLVFGAPDIYEFYAPEVEQWKRIRPTWSVGPDGICRDGDRFVSVGGGIESAWDAASGALRFALVLAPGECRTVDVVLGKGSPEKPRYEETRSAARTGWRKELARVDGRSPLLRHLTVQMLQCLSRPTEGEFLLPRQGGLQRYVWPGETMEVTAALAQLGYREYVRAVFDFYWNECRQGNGRVGPFANDWASETGCVLGAFAQYCLESGDDAYWRRYRAAAEKAFRWIVSTRHETDGRTDCTAGLFPPMKSSDSKKVFQHWGMTDVINWRALDACARAAARFSDPVAAEARAEAAAYRRTIEDVLAKWRARSDGKDTFFIPLAPDGANEDRLRADHFFYLHPGAFADSGLIDGDEMLRLRNWMLREGVASPVGLYLRHTSKRPELGRQVWYTTWAESQWYRAWKRIGRDDLARQALDACLKYSVTDEFLVGERIHEDNAWFFPWSPNASGAARIVRMLLQEGDPKLTEGR